jgi:rhamnulokinase
VYVAAVDLGASSGRVMLVDVAPDGLVLQEVSRFPNTPVEVAGRLHWDIRALYDGALEGLRRAIEVAPDLAAVGIDSWAVDYGLLGPDGELLSDPVHYRDSRTEGVVDLVHAVVSAEELYAVTGLQQQPFNTLIQLVAGAGESDLLAAQRLLLIPDLLAYWLTGHVGAERTNASTTQMYDVTSGTWATGLLDRLDLPTRILPELLTAGTVIGSLRAEVQTAVGATDHLQLVAVGSHDTASAVVGVPAADEHFAYISSGTWSLVGVELDHPVLTDAAREANFTNEGGVDGTIRFLRNVMGLWLVQESLRVWASDGGPVDLTELLAQAAELAPLTSLVDPDDPSLLPPGDQPARIAALCARAGEPVPASGAETLRTILDSLALAYRRAVRTAAELSGRRVDVIHVVGGGANNALLCQLTADACGVPVLAGPVEAAAIGSALVQARALGALSGDLAQLRSVVRQSKEVTVTRYEPAGNERDWAAAEARVSPAS